MRRFYVRRCLRIWPLYFLVVGLACLIYSQPDRMPAVFSASRETWLWLRSHLWLYLGFLSNWSLALNYIGGHADPSPGMLRMVWSIAVEEQFYLLYPLLMVLALRPPRLGGWLIATIVSGAWCFRFWFAHVPVDQPLPPAYGGMYYATFSYGDIFVAGAMAGWMAAAPANNFLRHLNRAWLGPALCAGILFCGWLWRRHLWYPYTTASVVFYGVAGVLFALFILWTTVNPSHPLCRLLGWPPLRALGSLSYGIYLWHVPSNTMLALTVLPWVDRLQLGVDAIIVLRLGLSLIGVIIFSTASYWLVERPFLRLKTHFRPPLPDQP